MSSPDPLHPITRMLNEVERDDEQVADDLLPLMHSELSDLAKALLAREPPGQKLQPTALVHEVYLRVIGEPDPAWHGRSYFFAAAAEAMRRILIDQARHRSRLEHGGAQEHSDVGDIELPIEGPSGNVLAVDEALEALESADPRARRIVNLCYFAGFTTPETAEALDLPVATIEREWRFIRTWLRDALGSDAPTPGRRANGGRNSHE